MQDNTIDPGVSGVGDNSELTADVSSLSIDGTDPEVGDHVEFKVGGTVKQVVNGVATITAETINGTPMPSEPSVADSGADDSSQLGQMAQMADKGMGYA